jgi:hypothetical protein
MLKDVDLEVTVRVPPDPKPLALSFYAVEGTKATRLQGYKATLWITRLETERTNRISLLEFTCLQCVVACRREWSAFVAIETGAWAGSRTTESGTEGASHFSTTRTLSVRIRKPSNIQICSRSESFEKRR